MGGPGRIVLGLYMHDHAYDAVLDFIRAPHETRTTSQTLHPPVILIGRVARARATGSTLAGGTERPVISGAGSVPQQGVTVTCYLQVVEVL